MEGEEVSCGTGSSDGKGGLRVTVRCDVAVDGW